MAKDDIVAMDGHHPMNASRLAEKDMQDYLKSLPGNPDNHLFYPGEHPTIATPSYLIEALGHARAATTSAYEAYKTIKDIEDQIRYELEVTLNEMGLKSAKGSDFTASIVTKPTITITRESDVIDWLRNTPDVEPDFYIGLKTTEFKTLAQSLLKNTGELVPGTEVIIKESLSIRSNTIKKAA